jgi:hypothetical protein
MWLRANTAPDAIVFTGAIGHVGYLSERYLLDGARLVTPDAFARAEMADFRVASGYVESSRACGPIMHFGTGDVEQYVGPVVISACRQEAWGDFGDLTLDQMRFAPWLFAAGEWSKAVDGPKLESQWLTDKPLPPQSWTFYVHFVDGAGKTLAQADHELGRQATGVVAPLDIWNFKERAYTYAELPADWEAVRRKVESLRVGLWNPATGVHLPVQSNRFAVDENGALVIPIEAVGRHVAGSTQ